MEQSNDALFNACKDEDWEAVMAQLSCDTASGGTVKIETPYQEEHDNCTCLHMAVGREAPCHVVRAILDAHSDCPVRITRLKMRHGYTALHTAAQRVEGRLFFDAAALRGAAARLDMLIESDPDCTAMVNDKGYTPLHVIIDPSRSYLNFPIEASVVQLANDVHLAGVRALLKASTLDSILSSNPDTSSALHLACSCSGLDLEIVKVILESFPQAALAKDKLGNTPLHFAAGYLKKDVDCAKIALLLESLAMQGQAGAAAVNNYGQTPLHLATFLRAHRPSYQIALRMLVDSQPESTCVKAEDESTPLYLLQVVYAHGVGGRLHKLDGLEFKRYVKDMCEKSNLLIEAMLFVRHRHAVLYGEGNLWMTPQQSNSHNDKCLDHSLMHNYLRLGMECPLDFVRVLENLYPHQVQMKDPRGDLPLHIALENGVQHANLIASLFPNRNTTVSDGSNLIKTLIDAYPQAAKVPNRNGDLPFQILVQNREGENGWQRGVQPLLRAHPAALLYGNTDLLPVLLPLILSKVGEKENLSALYEFVREMPLDVLRHANLKDC